MTTLHALTHPTTDADPSDLMALVQTSDELVELLHGFFTRLDTRRSQDFETIAGYIEQAKAEIRDLRPQASSQTGFSTAGAELQAITRDTEGATNAIMTAAEVMMDMSPGDPGIKDRIDDEVMKIFEACSFQDITGQRVSKIVKVLTQIEVLVSHLADAVGIVDDDTSGAARELSPAEQRARDLLLNGPAIGGPETRQDAIDDIFAASAATEPAPTTPDEPNSQDDIDALFA